MAQTLDKKLDAGDAFPDLALKLLGGKQTTVAAHLGGKWSVLLIYRGDW